MKTTRKNLRKLILEKINTNNQYDNFDFNVGGGGSQLPPVEPPSGGGGGGNNGGGKRSEFPLMLVGIFIKGKRFGAETIDGDDAYIDFASSSITVAADVEGGTVDCILSFYEKSLGYTNIIDMISLKCRSEEDVRRVYIAIHNFLVAISIADLDSLNNELLNLGPDFFDRYFKKDFLDEYKS